MVATIKGVKKFRLGASEKGSSKQNNQAVRLNNREYAKGVGVVFMRSHAPCTAASALTFWLSI